MARARPVLRTRLIAATLTTLALLAVLEGLARGAEPEIPRWKAAAAEGLQMVAHPTRLWTLPEGKLENGSNYATIGTNGMREPAPAPAPGVARTLVVGDSSFFGHALADSDALPVQLSTSLASRGIPAAGLNGAVPGYSTAQTRVLLDEVGWSLRPDLLVVGNLWSDNSADAFADADLLRTSTLFAANPLSKSALFQVSASWIANARGEGPRVIEWTRSSSWPTRRIRRVPLHDYARNLDAIVRDARAHNVGVLFVAPANRAMVEGQQSAEGHGWDPYFKAQAQVAEWHGAPLVSATEALRASGLSADDAFVDVMHPSAAGVGVLAEAIATALLARGWPSDRLLGRGEDYVPRDLYDFQQSTETGQSARFSAQSHLFRGADTPESSAAPLMANGTISGGQAPYTIAVVDAAGATWAKLTLPTDGPFTLACPSDIGVAELVFTDAAGHSTHRPLDPRHLTLAIALVVP